MSKLKYLLLASLFSLCVGVKLMGETPKLVHALPPASDPLPKYGKERVKEFSRPFIQAAKVATPCVVYIQAEGIAYSSPHPFEFFSEDLFSRFFGTPQQKRRTPQTQVSQGSGFFVSSAGHILTNHHVVRGAKKITVLLPKETSYGVGVDRQVSASFVGGDERTDVAVIKIDDTPNADFPHLDMGDSDGVEVGEWILAVGNPFQLETTVTAGIISAKGRKNLQITDLEDFLQTDAPINPGNSGGPLIDLNGKVVGMSTAIVSRSGGYMGIGFAIPSNMLKNIKEQLIKDGSVSRGFLGIRMQPVDSKLAKALGLKHPKGVLIVEVAEGSPSAEAGLKQGDLITHIDGQEVTSPDMLQSRVMSLKPHTEVVFKVNRDGKILSIPVELGVYGQSIYLSSPTSSRSIGITVDNLTQENISEYRLGGKDKGVVITDVHPDSPAEKIGFKPGFVIMAINRQEVKNVKDFSDALKEMSPDQDILVLVKSGPEVRFFVIANPDRLEGERKKRKLT